MLLIGYLFKHTHIVIIFYYMCTLYTISSDRSSPEKLLLFCGMFVPIFCSTRYILSFSTGFGFTYLFCPLYDVSL